MKPATNSYKKQNNFLKVAKVFGNIVFYSIIIFIIIVALLAVIGKAKDKTGNISIFGYSFYVVATPSMSHKDPKFADFLEGHDDQIQVGDLIIAKQIPKNYDLQMYDIVTFIHNDKVIVHRIVDIYDSSIGITMYKTRGDANVTSDGTRSRDEFLGILVKNAGGKAGTVVKFVQSGWGIAAAALVIAVIIGATLIWGTIKKKEDIAKEPDDLPDGFDKQQICESSTEEQSELSQQDELNNIAECADPVQEDEPFEQVAIQSGESDEVGSSFVKMEEPDVDKHQ